MGYEEILLEAKRLARSELSVEEWRRFGFHEVDLDKELGPAKENCDRIHCNDLSVEDFVQKYEIPCKPCVIEGLIDHWPAKNWTFETLKEKYGGACLKCGEDDEGNKVKLSLNDFIRYMFEQQDDAPMYVFDEFGDDMLLEEGETDTKPLLDDYSVPEYFSEDLMQYLGEEARPPFRWLLIGPQRSGSGVHIDPCCTSAWNSIIIGRKRWVLFPPDTLKTILKPAHWLQRPDRQAIDWFLRELPAICAQLPAEQQPIDVITGPGSTMFVPTNWWHAVLNLDHTLAVTQNFVSTTNFSAVYACFRTARAKLSRQWLRALDRAGRGNLLHIAGGGSNGCNGYDGGNGQQCSRSQQAKRLKNGLATLHRNSQGRSKAAAIARWRVWLTESRAAADGQVDGTAAGATEEEDSAAGAAPSQVQVAPHATPAAGRLPPPAGPLPAAAEVCASGREGKTKGGKSKGKGKAAAAAGGGESGVADSEPAHPVEVGAGSGPGSGRPALPSKWLRTR